jgi:hypothetical protein
MGSVFRRLLLDPSPDASGGAPSAHEAGGGEQPGQGPAPQLDSTAGMSPQDLGSRPDFGPADPSSQAGGGAATPGDPNLAAATRQGQQPGQAPSIREAAQFYGLDLSQYQDDAQAFAALVQQAQQARQRNYYAELGQQLAPHHEQIQAYLRQQQAQGRPPAERPHWQAPDFDERWLALVDKDPTTGTFIAKPGVNPAYADQVNAYAEHVDRWSNDLVRNPEEALGGLIRKVAGELLESRFGAHYAQSQAQSIIASNQDWLYATDERGQRLVGQDGRFLPTPLGARYYTHLQVLQRSGVRDAATLDALAKRLLAADHASGMFRAGTGTEPAQAGAQARQAQHRPQVNAGQAVPRERHEFVPGATDPDEAGLSLQERFRRAMARDGVTDADIEQSIFSAG